MNREDKKKKARANSLKKNLKKRKQKIKRSN